MVDGLGRHGRRAHLTGASMEPEDHYDGDGSDGDGPPHPDDRALLVSIGERLRAARKRRGWSLATMAEMSGGIFKPSAVANYERGDRALSAVRLVQLAELYRTTPAELLDSHGSDTALIDLTRRGPQEKGTPVPLPRLVIDVAALEQAERSPDMQMVWNVIRSLRAERTDPAGVISLRAADVAHLARALARTPESIAAELGGAVVEFLR